MLPDRHTPYSVKYLIAHGERESAERLLAVGGATLDDLPELRRRALALIPSGPE